MNSGKEREYSLLGNINLHPEQLKRFEWWRKRVRKRYLNISLEIILLAIIVVAVVLMKPKETRNYSVPDMIFGVMGITVFVILALFYIYKWIKSFSWSVERAALGEVVEKSRYSVYTASKGRNFRAYYVRAKIRGEIVEGRCEYEVYRELSKGNAVLLFSIGTKEIFAIKA